MTLWFTGKVHIEAEHDWPVNSVTFSMQAPAVIRFLRSPTHRKRRIRMSRENIYLRDDGTCQYCGDHVSRGAATYDHVLPRSQGGQTSWTNVVLCCEVCNRKKGARTPAEAKMVLRSTPAKPTYVPDVWSLTMEPGQAPTQWAQFLRDYRYWNTTLDP